MGVAKRNRIASVIGCNNTFLLLSKERGIGNQGIFFGVFVGCAKILTFCLIFDIFRRLHPIHRLVGLGGTRGHHRGKRWDKVRGGTRHGNHDPLEEDGVFASD